METRHAQQTQKMETQHAQQQTRMEQHQAPRTPRVVVEEGIRRVGGRTEEKKLTVDS